MADSSIDYQFFPRSEGVVNSLTEVILSFDKVSSEISSSKHKHNSNQVLEILRPSLEELGFKVESGKKKNETIPVPVLYGRNGSIDKSFKADAISNDGRIVIEVEAGRAYINNQFLKDIFQASMMEGVDYLVIAVRSDYRGKNDFESIYAFLETMYVSSRMQLPLKGILLVGY